MAVVAIRKRSGEVARSQVRTPRRVTNADRQRPVLTSTLNRPLYMWIKQEAERRGVTTSKLTERLIELGRNVEERGLGNALQELEQLRQQLEELQVLRERYEELKALYEEKECLEQEVQRLTNERRGGSAEIVERLCEVIKRQQQELEARRLVPGLSDDALRLRRLVPLVVDLMPSVPVSQELTQELAKALGNPDYVLPQRLVDVVERLEGQLVRWVETAVRPEALPVSRVGV